MIDINKKIFITGATGFIGANLVHRLVSLGAKNIHILVRKNSNLSRIDSVLDKVNIHIFSLEERNETLRYISIIQPNIVFHIAAAGTAVGRTPLNASELIQINTLGTMNLIDALIEVGGCEIFINTGSSSEYGQKNAPMIEYDSIEPNNFYGVSKAAATHYTVLVGKQKKLPTATYRIFAAYGPYEDSKRLIPTLLQSYLEGIPPKLSSPTSVRDFIYVGDIITAFLKSDTAVLRSGDIINLGTGIQNSVAEVVGVLQEITYSSIVPEYGNSVPNQIEPHIWVSDPIKMNTILNIQPKSLYEGLRETLEWMKQ